MQTLKAVFWILAVCVLYTYAIYPLLLWVLTRLRRRMPHHFVMTQSVSVVIAARDEAQHISRKIDEFARALQALPLAGRLIVVSDGSSDNTVELAMARAATCGVACEIVELLSGVGKASALNQGVARATGDVVVFADARQTWASDALERLLENFADPAVGAASGDLVVENKPGVMDGIGLYWRYEKWLRNRESELGSLVGVTGAICAVRRELYTSLPDNTVLDDMYWPLCVAMRGFRVVHDPRAIAYDRLPDRPKAEFRRKVRTLAGNFQLVARLPRLLLPWRNPVWAQFVSHKLLRLAVPWALLGMLIISAIVDGLLYRALLVAQTSAYIVAIAGLADPIAKRSRVCAAAGSFLMLNYAAWVAFWVWALGNTRQSWNKTAYIKTRMERSPDPTFLRSDTADTVRAASPHESNW